MTTLLLSLSDCVLYMRNRPMWLSFTNPDVLALSFSSVILAFLPVAVVKNGYCNPTRVRRKESPAEISPAQGTVKEHLISSAVKQLSLYYSFFFSQNMQNSSSDTLSITINDKCHSHYLLFILPPKWSILFNDTQLQIPVILWIAVTLMNLHVFHAAYN